MSRKLYIGVDIGGTKMAAGLVAGSGQVLKSVKVATPLAAKAGQIYRHLGGLLAELLAESDTGRTSLSGIGLGVPGVVGVDQRKILVTPNINLAGFPLADKLEAEFRVPVLVGNDVNLGVLGEKWVGAGREVSDLVGIFVGTGIGGAVIARGQLFLGAGGAAAEIGHMVLMLGGPACSCGNHGCFEALAGRRAIERAIQAAVRQGKKTLVTKLTGGKYQVIKSRVLREALQKKDPVVLGIMKREAQILGQACVSVNHLFNPEMIILGGGVIKACGDFLVPKVQEIVSADPFFQKFNTCVIRPSELGDDAVILGAAALVRGLAGGR